LPCIHGIFTNGIEMKLVLLYTVLVSMYDSDEIVGKCAIYDDTYNTTCTVNGEEVKGVIDIKGLIWAHSVEESFVLRPRGSADQQESVSTSDL